MIILGPGKSEKAFSKEINRPRPVRRDLAAGRSKRVRLTPLRGSGHSLYSKGVFSARRAGLTSPRAALFWGVCRGALKTVSAPRRTARIKGLPASAPAMGAPRQARALPRVPRRAAEKVGS